MSAKRETTGSQKTAPQRRVAGEGARGPSNHLNYQASSCAIAATDYSPVNRAESSAPITSR